MPRGRQIGVAESILAPQENGVVAVRQLLSYIQKEMHRLHTETTRSSDYLLKTVLLLYLLRPAASRVAGCVTTRSRSRGEERTPGRPLQPLLQHAAAVQQVPKEQQPEQQTDQSCSTGTRRI